MMKSTVLLVIALAAGTASADEAKKPDATADAKPKGAAKDAAGASAEVKAGTSVEKHEIVGEATSFPAGTASADEAKKPDATADAKPKGAAKDAAGASAEVK